MHDYLCLPEMARCSCAFVSTYSSRRILNIEVTNQGQYGSFVDLAWILSRLIRSRKRSSMVRELFDNWLTGSGKTSTYYTTLRFLQNDGMKIISLEDPVEQFLDGVVQVEVGKRLDWIQRNNSIGAKEWPWCHSNWRNKDEETARAVINAAFSSRLVIATMHSRDYLMHSGDFCTWSFGPRHRSNYFFFDSSAADHIAKQWKDVRTAVLQ